MYLLFEREIEQPKTQTLKFIQLIRYQDFRALAEATGIQKTWKIEDCIKLSMDISSIFYGSGFFYRCKKEILAV